MSKNENKLDYSNVSIQVLAYRGPYNNAWTWAPRQPKIVAPLRVTEQHNRFPGMMGDK